MDAFITTFFWFVDMFRLALISLMLMFSVLLSPVIGNDIESVYSKGSFPYVLKEVFGRPQKQKSNLVISDVDCDRRDEFLYLNPGANVRNHISLWDEHTSNVSWILNSSNELGRPLCANLNNTGDLEIVVPEKIENSVYLNVYTSEMRLLQRFFTCEGVDLNSNGEWDGELIPRIALDLSGERNLEIVASIASFNDLYPRGICAFNWEKGKEIWRFETGTQITDISSADLDGDNQPEIICSTSAPNNGSIANETDDKHSYIIVLDKDGNLVRKKETGGIFSGVSVFLEDIDSDGKLDIVTILDNWLSKKRSEIKISIVDSKTWRSKREMIIYSKINALDIKDINNDGKFEFILLCQNGQLLVLNSQLKTVREFSDPQKSNCMLVEDLNNDGKLEVILSNSNIKDRKTIVLDNELKKVLAVFDDGGIPYSVRTNPGQPKRLALMAADYLYFLDLVKVPPPPYQTYLIYGLVVALLLFIIFSLRKRIVKPPAIVEPQFLHAIPGGLMAIDKKGKISFCSQKAREIFGFQNKSIVGEQYREVMKGDDQKEIVNLIDRAQKESWQGVEEVQMKIGNETKNLLVNITSFSDGKGIHSGSLIMVDDVTEVIWSQRALAWATVAQQAAHKIKNPLTMMNLALQRIQDVSCETFGEEAKKLDKYIETNRKQIASLLKMTDVFMQIADLKPPNFQPTNINHVIECVVDKFAESFSKGIELSLNLDKNLPNVRADERQMETVIENLITNAVAAMGRKGSLDVTTGFSQRFQESKETSAVKEYAQIEISDTGRGIPSEDKDKLFDQFFSRREGGTGLGLAIVKKIVDDHGGLINVDSEEGVGTTVAISIPVW